jgi:hypothetical protein
MVTMISICVHTMTMHFKLHSSALKCKRPDILVGLEPTILCFCGSGGDPCATPRTEKSFYFSNEVTTKSTTPLFRPLIILTPKAIIIRKLEGFIAEIYLNTKCYKRLHSIGW